MMFPKTLFGVLLAGMLLAEESVPGLASRNPRYLLQPTDVLEVNYRYTPEFNQTVTVQPDGYVSLRITGDLKLAGLSLDQAKAALVEKSAARLRDPEISLVLKEFEKPHFVVGGEVTNPGRFELRGSVSALEAVAMAGGFKSASAKHSQVILVRKVGNDLGQTKLLNLKAAMKDPGAEPVQLQTGDVLLVPQNQVSKIERFIKWTSVGVFWNPVAR